MLVVVTGKMRSGKDTLGDYLVKAHRFIKTPALADPFKKSASEWFDWDERHLYGELKEEVDPRWGFSPRQFFQVFGTELMKEWLGFYFPQYKETVGNTIWAQVFVNWYKRQDPTKRYVLTDMRFPEEYSTLTKLKDVFFIKTISDRSPQNTHSSEQHIDSFKVDYTIVNNGWGSYDDFYAWIDAVAFDLTQKGY